MDCPLTADILTVRSNAPIDVAIISVSFVGRALDGALDDKKLKIIFSYKIANIYLQFTSQNATEGCQEVKASASTSSTISIKENLRETCGQVLGETPDEDC